MITAIVLAAGESKRMGQPKMLMPWGNVTVIEKVLATLQESGVDKIVVVTGALHDVLAGAANPNIYFIKNEEYANGEMLGSVKIGLQALGPETEAALIVLGDQPQIESKVVITILMRYKDTHHLIIAPSYKMHRGHPWLVERAFWGEIMQLRPPDTLREFLNIRLESIDYIEVDTSSILLDIDTPVDYDKYKP